MRKNLYLFVFFYLLTSFQASAALIIYKGTQKIVTGTWGGSGTLAEVSTNSPYEGTQHYQFDYNFTSWWAGYGLNFDNWGTGPAINFSTSTHLRLAYRGANGSQVFRVKLKDGTNFSSIVDIGTPNTSYQVVTIPLNSFTGLSLSSIREIDFEIGNVQTGSGTVFIDAVELINIAVTPPPPSSAVTWSRLNAMGKGFNTANWLEAYWLIPFNTYPVVNDYKRSTFQSLKNAGFNNVRLPVTFERMGSQTAPYTLNTNQTAFYLVDSVILWANTFNMKLIIVNHHGYDMNDGNFSTQTPRICKVWKQLIQKYSYLDPNRFMFEIYNEPNNITNSNWRTVAQSIVDTIRTYNTTHTLVVGGNGWNSMSGLTSFQPLNDNNIIYTFHCYEPYYFTHQGMSWTSPSYFPSKTFPVGSDVSDLRTAFTSIKQWSTTNSVAVFMGEFGVGTPADATSRCNYVDKITHFADSLSMPWTYWDVKNYADAFGIFPSGVMSSSSVIPCIKTAMGLYASPLSLSELSSLKANCDGTTVHLDWRAALYDKAGIFVVEKSSDGVHWDAAKSISGTLQKHDYQADIQKLFSDKFFRLAYIGTDGKVDYSEIITTACQNGASLSVYPNPISGNDLTVDFTSSAAQDLKITLFSMSGQVVQKYEFSAQHGQNTLPIPVDNLSKGVYQLLLVTEQGENMAVKVVKN